MNLIFVFCVQAMSVSQLFHIGGSSRLVVSVHSIAHFFFFFVPCPWLMMSAVCGRYICPHYYVTWCTWVADLYFELCEGRCD